LNNLFCIQLYLIPQRAWSVPRYIKLSIIQLRERDIKKNNWTFATNQQQYVNSGKIKCHLKLAFFPNYLSLSMFSIFFHNFFYSHTFSSYLICMFISDISIMHAIHSLVINGGQGILITFITLSQIWCELLDSRVGCNLYFIKYFRTRTKQPTPTSSLFSVLRFYRISQNPTS